MSLRGSIPSDTQTACKVMPVRKDKHWKDNPPALAFQTCITSTARKGAVMPSYIKKMQERGIHRVFMNTLLRASGRTSFAT